MAVCTGWSHTVGVKADGTAVAVGENDDGQCNVSNWRDIVAVCSGGCHTVGLKADGTVTAAGYSDDGRGDVSDWRDIVAICSSDWHTVGLKADGTVVATGDNDCGQCNVSDWRDIVAVCVGTFHTVGVKADGTVVAVGENHRGQCNVSDWQDIVAVCTEDSHTVGLKADGTVVAVGDNDDGQCNVSEWQDIVAVCTGDSLTVGLKADGTVAAVGNNDDGQCGVEKWKLFDNLEQERMETQQRHQEEKQRRQEEKRNVLEAERTRLQAELPNIKGLFSGGKRRQVEARLAEIEAELKKIMSEQYRRFPQVLLLGNGLNRVVQSDGWGDLLARIKRNPKICINDDTYSSLPYPLLAVLATNDQVDQAIKENINLFYGASDDAMEELRPCLQQLLGMGFDDILTTNYSYELERAADQSVTREGSNCKKWMRHTEEIISAERKYLLHTYNAVSYRGINNRVWHIHGEIRKPDSVILGHYYYGKLFSKYQELLNQRGNRQFVLEQQGKPPIMKSWLECVPPGGCVCFGIWI